MPRRKAGGRVVMGPEPHFSHCERCGGTDPKPGFPISIPALQAYVAYLEAKHRDCEPQAVGP